MKVAIYTLGCKVNQYETQAMEQTLRAKGHQVVEFSDEADAYVVNTCSVTAVSDQKSRQVIHRVQKQHPAAVVTMWRPTWRFCQQAARMAQLSPSVPQEVKKSWFASQSTALAITARQSSTLRRISCPKGYCALGLAYCSVSTVYMASATALGTGVVAAWSR